MTACLPRNVQACVDSICQRGCERVNEIIELLEAGKSVDEVCKLDHDGQKAVLRELKAIMAVYEQKQE